MVSNLPLREAAKLSLDETGLFELQDFEVGYRIERYKEAVEAGVSFTRMIFSKRRRRTNRYRSRRAEEENATAAKTGSFPMKPYLPLSSS